MKKRIWIGSIVLISTLFCSYFAFAVHLGNREIKAQSFKTEETVLSNKTETISDLESVDINKSDIMKDNYCFISKKTTVRKEELEQSRGILKFTDSVNWKEYQSYQADKKIITANINMGRGF